MYRLVRFSYLSTALVAITLVAALAFSALAAWRSVMEELSNSVNRAVFNADRLLDRTVSDLSKLDPLRGLPCDAGTTRLLQEAVYGSLSQIREIGLIRKGLLYCTNFGVTPKEIPIDARLTEPGVHLDVSPNSVMPNNTSLYVYVSRERGTAIDALFNPQVLAEFERDFSYSGYGRLWLEVKRSAAQIAQNPAQSTIVYSVGDVKAADSQSLSMTKRFESARSAFAATAEVSPRVLAREIITWLPFFLSAFSAIALAAWFGMRHWLARGNLDRLRYLSALQRNEFLMHYQPIIEVKTMKIVGVEALLRWQHPRRGLLRAAQFIDIFSHDSLAAPLAERVMQFVREDLQKMPSEMPLWCALNLAPTLLDDNRALDALTKQILASDAGRIQIEITERAPLGEYAEVLLHELRSRGVKVGMDDLGTGYANLDQLQRMPFDFIKIDSMLVRGIHAVDGVSPVVKALIELARGIGAEVIVEGVETKTQADALTKAGATHLQGFYFGAARSIDEVIELVKNQRHH